jgi:uncharacterized protein YdeI (BOF family)
MKKIIITAAVLFFSAAAFAQQNVTGTRQNTNNTPSLPENGVQNNGSNPTVLTEDVDTNAREGSTVSMAPSNIGTTTVTGATADSKKKKK